MKTPTQKEMLSALHNLLTFGYQKLTEREKDIIDFRTGSKLWK